MDNRSYSLEEVAEKINVDYQAVCVLIRDGKLASVKIGKLTRVSEKQLKEYTRPKKEDALPKTESLIKGEPHHADKLVLEYNGMTLFLFNKKNVTLGRNPKCADLPVSCVCTDPATDPNRTISRIHAEILSEDDHIVLRDHSTFGTFIDDKKMDKHSDKKLNQDAVIGFGDCSWNMKIYHCKTRSAHKVCSSCAAKKIKAVSFSRRDDKPDFYLLIWQCCELETLDKTLAGWTVYTRDGAFFIRTADKEFLYLSPGMEIPAGKTNIKVREFSLTYFRKQKQAVS